MSLQEEVAPAVPQSGFPERGRLAAYASLVRVRQWVKNGTVLAGLFFSDQLFRTRTAAHSLAAALAFCLVSGAVYAFNDVLDREADAKHPEKRNRPIASGAIGVRRAIAVGAILLALAGILIGIAGFAWEVPAFLGTYLVANILYSFWLKHISLVDLIVIASGFVLRLEAGIYAVGVKPSSWIVLCTGLLSIFLALAKRRGDLTRELVADRRSLAGYTLAYIDQSLGMMGAATIVVYAIFTVSPYAQRRFHAPLLYLTTFPVAIGILRYLQITIVQGRYASPTDVVLRDRPLQLVLVAWVALFFVFVYR